MKGDLRERESEMTGQDVDGQKTLLLELKDESLEKEDLIHQLSESLRRKADEEKRVEEQLRDKDDLIRQLEA